MSAGDLCQRRNAWQAVARDHQREQRRVERLERQQGRKPGGQRQRVQRLVVAKPLMARPHDQVSPVERDVDLVSGKPDAVRLRPVN